MALHGLCPECGGQRPLEEYLAEVRERQALKAALEIDPRLAEPLLDYLGLFAPPGRRIAARKRARLLVELGELVGAGQITVKRQIWPAPVEYWRVAMEEMTGPLRAGLELPLGSHRYLMAVVAGLARKASGRQEAERERGLRGATPVGGGGASHRPFAAAPEPRRPADPEASRNGMQELRRAAGLKPLTDYLPDGGNPE